MQSKKNPLSNELKVACEIYKAETNKEPVWFSRLEERLKPIMSSNTLAGALFSLADFGIVKGGYGPTEKGRAGYLYKIDDCHKKRIKTLYLDYWRDSDENRA